MILNWPGSKKRLIPQVAQLVPKRPVCSPFLGGGSVEIELACTRKVYGYDIMPSLVNFWTRVLENPEIVAENARMYYPIDKETFSIVKGTYKMQSKVCALGYSQAALFFILNKASMYGMMSNFGQDRFTENSITELAEFECPNLTVNLHSFENSIPANEDRFLYCDPPYCELLLDKRVYRDPTWDSKPDFDHRRLAGLLKKRDAWILHYDDCATVRSLYEGYPIWKPVYRYGMGNRSMASKEIMICSNDIDLPCSIETYITPQDA